MICVPKEERFSLKTLNGHFLTNQTQILTLILFPKPHDKPTLISSAYLRDRLQVSKAGATYEEIWNHQRGSRRRLRLHLARRPQAFDDAGIEIQSKYSQCSVKESGSKV